MSFHGSATVTSAGTSVPLVALTQTNPLLRFCAAVTIQYASTHNMYGGFGVAAADVSATSYGWTLNSTDRSITIGDPASRQNNVDLATIRVDSDTSNEKVRFTAEQF